MSPIELGSATEAINHLFDTLSIRRVISVDDLYVAEHTPDDLIGLLTASPTAAAGITELKDFDLTAPPEIWNDRLRAIWNKLPDERQISLLQQVRAATGYDQEPDEVVGGVLAQLFSRYEFRALTLAQWQTEKAALLDATTMPNTVILFDQSFTKESGTATAGIGLIQDACERCKDERLVCGLLSQNYSVDQEFEGWQQLAKEYHLETQQFVLIAKERLQGQLGGFATQIKLSVLNHKCDTLKQEAINVLETAHKKASEDLRAMNIYDFEHIVFRSSYREGVWEPDTLFRVFGLYHRAATRQLAKQSVALSKQADAIRQVSNLPIPSATTPGHTTWRIQRLELYEDDDYLNTHFLPTDLGDIYQKTKGNKQYMLLAQPCDLMVRNEPEPGRRPSVYEATLAEILHKPPEDSDAGAELKYFDPLTGQKAYVHFGRTHTVKLCVLDLCALRPDGHATLSTKEKCPDGVIPSWERYFIELQGEVENLLKRYEKFKKTESKDKELVALLTKVSHKGIITGDLHAQEERVEYHVKRIRRLLEPRSGEVLTRYAAYKSRDAFEHDFGDLPPTPTGTAPVT